MDLRASTGTGIVDLSVDASAANQGSGDEGCKQGMDLGTHEPFRFCNAHPECQTLNPYQAKP